MEDGPLPVAIVGGLMLCIAGWLSGDLIWDSKAVVEHVTSAEFQSEAADQASDSAARALAAQLEAAEEDLERRKRDLLWEAETQRVQHRARMRELDYKQRLIDENAEDARRKLRADQAKFEESLKQRRLDEDRQLRRRLAAEEVAKAAAREEEEQQPVAPKRVLPAYRNPPPPPVYAPRSTPPQVGGLGANTREERGR